MKSNIYRIVLRILFPVLFILLFFMFAGTEHGATCWIGFGFILFSYIVMLLTPMFVPESKSSHIFSFTGGTLTSTYFFVNLVPGLIFLIWDFEQWKIAIAIELVLLAAFLAIYLPLLISDEETAQKENYRQAQVQVVKNYLSKVKVIAGRAADMQTRKIILRIVDELNSCPSNTTRATKSVDSRISAELENLEYAVDINDSEEIKMISASLIKLIKERKEASRQQ